MNEIEQEKIDRGKKDVQKLLKDIFESYNTIEQSSLDRIKYKKSIYNSKNWLENEIDNVDYSDLLCCMLDTEDEFIDIKLFVNEQLNKIDKFKQQYMNMQEDEREEEEER